MKIYKLAFISLFSSFVTAALGTDVTSTANVTERKSCDEIATEISELSAIAEPDEETTVMLATLKQQQRSFCQKRAGARGTAAKNARRTKTTITEETPEPVNNECDTPDENGCCPGEKYTDMGELGFNCCPETGGDCFPPIIVSVEITESEQSPEPELTNEQRITNIESGLCADGTKPNKFGCCGDEVFKDMGNTIFACCPKSGGDCFPPIK